MTNPIRKAVITVLVAGLVPALGGCGEINDMLDAGAAGSKPKAEEASESGGGATGAQTAREKLDAYYNREPRKVEQDPNDPIVPCSLRGHTQFMRKSDCMLRGGSSA
jgi:hypothetical protein